MLSEEAKAKRREYYKAWRQANPDKTKKHTEDYWERRAAKEAATVKRIKNGGNEE